MNFENLQLTSLPSEIIILWASAEADNTIIYNRRNSFSAIGMLLLVLYDKRTASNGLGQ